MKPISAWIPASGHLILLLTFVAHVLAYWPTQSRAPILPYSARASRSTSTRAAPSVTASPRLGDAICRNQCDIYDVTTSYYWLKVQHVHTTITAATKVLFLDEATNRTLSTSLVFNDLPKGYILPPMNEAGTQTQEVVYTDLLGQSSKIVLTWPTKLVQYPAGYLWRGQLALQNPIGNQTCLTDTSYELRPYPSYRTAQLARKTRFPSHGNGLDYILTTGSSNGRPDRARNTIDPVLQSCNVYRNGSAGYADVEPNVPVTARYLTVTSTSKVRAAAATKHAAPPPMSPDEKGTIKVAAAPPPESVPKCTAGSITAQTAAQAGQDPRKSSMKSTTEVEPTRTPAAVLVIGGTTYSMSKASGTATTKSVFNIAGQILAAGSTITLGIGSAAQTIALKTDGAGNMVVVSASASKTVSSTIGNLGAGVTGTRTSGSGVALQTVNGVPGKEAAHHGILLMLAVLFAAVK